MFENPTSPQIMRLSKQQLKISYQKAYLTIQKALLANLYNEKAKEERLKIKQDIKETGEIYKRVVKNL